MMNSTRAIQRINEYIMNQGNEAEEVLQPVELDDLKENHKLCGRTQYIRCYIRF